MPYLHKVARLVLKPTKLSKGSASLNLDRLPASLIASLGHNCSSALMPTLLSEFTVLESHVFPLAKDFLTAELLLTSSKAQSTWVNMRQSHFLVS